MQLITRFVPLVTPINAINYMRNAMHSRKHATIVSSFRTGEPVLGRSNDMAAPPNQATSPCGRRVAPASIQTCQEVGAASEYQHPDVPKHPP